MLVAALRRLTIQGGRLTVAGADAEVLRVLEITGLDQVLGVHATREDGLAALRAGSLASRLRREPATST